MIFIVHSIVFQIKLRPFFIGVGMVRRLLLFWTYYVAQVGRLNFDLNPLTPKIRLLILPSSY